MTYWTKNNQYSILTVLLLYRSLDSKVYMVDNQQRFIQNQQQKIQEMWLNVCYLIHTIQLKLTKLLFVDNCSK